MAEAETLCHRCPACGQKANAAQRLRWSGPKRKSAHVNCMCIASVHASPDSPVATLLQRDS